MFRGRKRTFYVVCVYVSPKDDTQHTSCTDISMRGKLDIAKFNEIRDACAKKYRVEPLSLVITFFAEFER